MLHFGHPYKEVAIVACFFENQEIELPTERVQKGIAHWDKQNNNMPAPNCMLKV